MAVSPLQPNFELTSSFLGTTSHIGGKNYLQGIVQESNSFEDVSGQAGVEWCGKNFTSSEGVMPSAHCQEYSWQYFFSNPTQWWDTARLKPTQLHSHVSQLVIASCRKSGRYKQISDAVDALHVLAQQRCHVPHNLVYCVLKCCIAHKDLVLGRRIHALITICGYEGDAFLATHLIGLYASGGKLEEAIKVFTKVTVADAHIWATIIFACANNGETTKAIRLYNRMRQLTIKPDNRIYVAVLKACAKEGDIVAGRRVHAHILASPWKPDVYVLTSLVDMYAKCRRIQDARRVFDSISEKTVVTWNAMMGGYVQQGMYQGALDLYKNMQEEGNPLPDSATFLCLLQACAGIGAGALHQGRQLHAQVDERGLHSDAVLSGSLVNMYAKCGSLSEARRMLDTLPMKGVEAWTSMIAGYIHQGLCEEALNLYCDMLYEGTTPPNSITFVCLLQACATVGARALHIGKLLHEQVEKQGLQEVLGGSLVGMYGKCGSADDARKVFDTLPERGVVTWNAMMTGYVQQGLGQEALTLYNRMQKEQITPTSGTFVCLLQACASLGVGALDEGKKLHGQIKERGLQDDVAIGGSLVNLYTKCGSTEDARRVFDRLLEKSVVTWTTMMAAYAEQQLNKEALTLYSMMLQEGISPNSVTFVCLLQACAVSAALPMGKHLHAQIEGRGLRADVDVGAALVNMYVKCGSILDAQQVFDSSPEKTIEAWHALIAGYTRQGDSQVVFELFDRMRLAGVQPDDITFLSLLTVCCHVGSLDKGREYFQAMRTTYAITPSLEHYTCMIDLLGRAGHLNEALQMARTMPFPADSALWLSLLGACRKWNNVEIGEIAFKFAVGVEPKDPAPYVLMSNIYASTHMREEAREIQARRLKIRAWKQAGQSWLTDASGVGHTFVAGGKEHSEGIICNCEATRGINAKRLMCRAYRSVD